MDILWRELGTTGCFQCVLIFVRVFINDHSILIMHEKLRTDINLITDICLKKRCRPLSFSFVY